MYEIIAEGFIRAGNPVVKITGLPFSQSTKIEFRIFRSRQETGRIVVSWPGDFVVATGDEALSGTIVLSMRDELSPYTSITLSVDGQSISPGPKWHLDRLYAATEKEFEKYFFRTKNRTGDRETLLFAVSQIDKHYHVNQAHRCVAAVIRAYRAMDLGVEEYCAESIDWLERQTQSLGQLGVSEHPRMDRGHLTVSVRFALAQVYLVSGKYDQFVGALDEIIAYLRRGDDMFPGFIMNGCLSILLRCYLFAVAGKCDEAAELGAFNCELYVANLPRLGRHAILFKEMLMPHTAVYLSLQIAESIVAQRKLPAALVVAKAGHRINYPDAAEVFERNFARLCRGLSRQRGRAASSVSE